VAQVFDDTVMMTRSAKVSPVALRSEPSEVVQARDAKPRLSGRDAVHLLTGGLGFVRNNAKFEFGTAFLPKGQGFGTPTGGGNFYLFKGSRPTAARRPGSSRSG
jgi:hypothetical protein